MTTHLRHLCLLLLAAPPAWADDSKIKTEHFDSDPGWEGFNNRVELKKVPTVVQDFGYSPTKFASKENGEVGGKVTRAARPAYYAMKFGPKTFDDKFSASGTFALTGTTGGAGVFFGFFHAEQAGGSGRAVGSLGLDIDTEKGGGRLAVRMISQTNKSCGTFITPFVPGKFRPTPIQIGTRYTWTLTYDPAGAGGFGEIRVTLGKESVSLPLKKGQKAEGATLDRFGLFTSDIGGQQVKIYLDDLKYTARR